jgi:hypothetical protein
LGMGPKLVVPRRKYEHLKRIIFVLSNHLNERNYIKNVKNHSALAPTLGFEINSLWGYKM